ncbi:MAG TPA: hypothetical protein H9676_02515 [Firmicutes bacterium]|nr:hypothetical protein [Bacillota bacterium]
MSEKKFSYTYSAPTEEERREIESIRSEYSRDERSEKLERLRRLNARVKNVSMCVALTLGIAGLLVFGLGMAMILEWGILVGGVAVAAVGALPMAGAAPAYNLVLRHEKQKYGSEIVRLSEELLGEEA